MKSAALLTMLAFAAFDPMAMPIDSTPKYERTKYRKTQLTNKQKKSRAKSKMASKSRKNSRK